MFNRFNITILFFCLLLVAFGFGLYRLLALRFEAGDVFPPYSSLRSDPLGSKVLYEAFGHLSNMRVTRNFKNLEKLENDPSSTIFLFGLSPESLEHLLAKPAGDLAQHGHRLVITMLPVQGMARGCQAKPGAASGDSKAKTADKNSTSAQPNKKNKDSGDPVFKNWGFRLNYASLPGENVHSYPAAELVAAKRSEKFPPRVAQHSELFFAEPEVDWQVLYRVGDHPVIMERSWGDGSLVLVSDSYLVSNEAMRQDRQAAILSWLAGSNNSLVFDETHLGISRQPGVMTLVHQYRLTGFIGALLVLAFLYIWQRSVSLKPIRPATDPDGVEETSLMDYHAGLVNLLRRNIKEEELLQICFEEWQKSMPTAVGRMAEQAARIRQEVEAEKALRPRDRDLLGCYKKIAAILAERKYLWK